MGKTMRVRTYRWIGDQLVSEDERVTDGWREILVAYESAHGPAVGMREGPNNTRLAKYRVGPDEELVVEVLPAPRGPAI